jgi:hypothetical protein
LESRVSIKFSFVNRVGGRPLFERPSSHTTVRTVRYTAVQWITCSTSYYLPIPDIQVIPDIHFVRTVSLRAFRYCNALRSLSALGFHPAPLNTAGSHRFLLSTRCRYLPSTREPSIVRPFPLSSFRLSGGPPCGTMAFADFLHFSYTLPHRFLTGGTVRQSPYKVCARPPRVRASNLHPMQPPHLHHRVRVVSDFVL